MIVNAAMTWLHTPFKFQARKRGLGVDCVGLIDEAFRDAGIILNMPRYGRRNVFGRLMIDFLEASPLFRRVAGYARNRIVVISYDRGRVYAKHAGILVDHSVMIHARNPGGVMIEPVRRDHVVGIYEAVPCQE